MAEKKRGEEFENAHHPSDEEFALAAFAVDHAAIAVFILDEQARVIRVNQEACRSLGYTEDELLSLTLHEITAGFDMEQWSDHWRDLRRSGAVMLPDVHRRKDGSLVDVEIHANLLRFQGREINVAFALDFTERDRARKALEERERMLSTLFGNLPGMAYRCAADREWTMAFVSDGCVRLTEREPSALIGNASVAYADLIHPDDRALVWDEVSAALERREPWSIAYRLVMPDERVKWVRERGVGVRDRDHRLLYLEGFTTDISEQRRIEATLRDSEQRLQGLLANLPGVPYRSQTAPPWRDEYIGAGVEELSGYSTAQLAAGTPQWDEIMHPDDREPLRRETQDAIATGRKGELEYRIIRGDGEERWVWDRFVVARDQQGEAVALDGLLIDVTDGYRARQELANSREELALHERIAAVFLTRPTDEMFADVLDLVREALASRWGFFGYIADDGDLVAPSLTREVWDACQVKGKDVRFPRAAWGDTLWARALAEGTTQVLDRDGKVPKGHVPIDRAIAVPLTFSGGTIGIFIVANADADYTADDRRLLESIADYTAPVLHEWLQRASAESARLAAESSVRESESLHRTLFEQAPVGVVLYDTDLVILDCNDSFAQIVDASREQLIGFDLTTSPDSRPLDALRLPLLGGHGIYEGPYTTATTIRDLWLAVKTAPRLGADGEADGAIAVVTDRTSQRHAEDEMERLRLHDPVTGLPNRSLFADRIAQALAHARRKRFGFAVAAVAIDRFSSVVDTLSHEACDRLLAAAAERLTTAMRAEDTVACLAGSEFGLLLAGVGGPAQASMSIEKTVAAFARPFQIDGHELFLDLSLGVAVYPADGADPQDLIENAEVAARRASSGGGNGWQFFHASMNDERAGRLTLEGELHRALERDQFRLHYQPIVKAGSGEILGLEALLRWDRPGNGLVQPLDFIAVAEEIGLMVPVGAWALRTACAQARAWSQALGRPLRISVNLSARQLYEASLEATVRSALKESGLPARQLELEITETAAMRDPQQAGRILAALQKRHVRIALDDFGTGYSSLSHLVRLPIATVKIDRSFVRDLLSVPEHAAVAASVIALGHRLGLTVVAEGVETQDEHAFLRDEGCDALQGYLFSRPLPPEECARLLEAAPLVP